ncbi:MAG: hypothetical protein MJZ78_00035 [Bacteroidales bacterium]|nr:hypothetical protein [Bacteroidales bacterium]
MERTGHPEHNQFFRWVVLRPEEQAEESQRAFGKAEEKANRRVFQGMKHLTYREGEPVGIHPCLYIRRIAPAYPLQGLSRALLYFG